MNLLITPYRTIEYFEEESLILNTWTENTADLDENSLKNDFQQYMTEVVEKCKPHLVFHDVTGFQFAIVPELQKWIHNEVNKPTVEMSMKKIAFVVSKDIFSQVLIEQTMDEGGTIGIPTQYFENKEEALKWLRI